MAIGYGRSPMEIAIDQLEDVELGILSMPKHMSVRGKKRYSAIEAQLNSLKKSPIRGTERWFKQVELCFRSSKVGTLSLKGY